ncbi:hypothetical protein IC614_12110 [Allosphingosinicella flava]|uniref:Uncharacterized protein n=1 Tax=Allosphingosinicella flava TaxID=2771430 RepID=A0A7T2GJK1_9SPHN|nr:hypothetical protein [Sphingosinicella flava]QPQ55026.1 hypothetical protein IC614_12110 [Sphingosinicella flava]
MIVQAAIAALLVGSVPDPSPMHQIINSAHDAGETGRFENGHTLYYHYIVQYWQEYPAGSSRGENPSASAPGQFNEKPSVYVHGKVPPKEADLIARKLEVAHKILMELPSLKDIRGASLLSSINIRRTLSGHIEAELKLFARPISLGSPRTIKINGRYYTPGEGTSLDVEFNMPLFEYPRNLGFLSGKYNGNLLAYEDVFVVNSSRWPLQYHDHVDDITYFSNDPDFFDRTIPPSKLQLLVGKIRGGPPDMDLRMNNQGLSETEYISRLYAALYMADWNEIARKMEEVR